MEIAKTRKFKDINNLFDEYNLKEDSPRGNNEFIKNKIKIAKFKYSLYFNKF